MAIDPDFLDELDRFDAALDRETAAVRQGEQQSPRVGEGLTFSDYRRYSPGDDTRLVDWKLFARTEEYYIKQFEEERNLTVHVLLDSSASMDYGDGESHKFEYAAKIGLGFCYLTAEEHNDFRFSTMDERSERLDTGRSNRGEVLGLIDQVNDLRPEGEADFETVLEAYADRIRSRSLVVVLTDCLDEPERIESGVSALARNEVDVLLVRVMAPDERDPDVVGDALFADPESETTRRSYFSQSLADTYRSRLDAHVDEVNERVTALGGDHVLVDTGDEYFDSFASVWLG
ncbi:hypothetical protein C475_15288 [Halosimplex carlsbadense 2-9-1]|uniref:DUF58 domain-containing protein n=1 Tax=Halosimplex carlsbadense 2-9-1 TaxID=797114 RepID=M0CMM2_9EURY|nr:DUF58 domain-containing protein [Halosimplex carlsbadense]ELZ23647.1 hypothetical protein C475_15288 [Halosimplex carlsbadense 2-9-1]